MKIDRNKGITSVTYNYLDLPEQVNFGSQNIQYVYSADGTKLKRTSSTGTETLYAGAYIYEGAVGNAQLQFFPHAEGYVMSEGNDWRYVYQYKDHLGNVRLSYTEDPNGGLEIVEDNAYYPFGLKMRGFNGNVSPLGNDVAQRWKFGGKELDESLDIDTYDFGARNYDHTLGRWMNIDPLAEDYSATSPYVFALNNPLAFIDPDGRKVVNADEERKKQAEKELKSNQNIVTSAESLYGTEKGAFKSKAQFKRYKKAKRSINKSKRQVAKFTRRSATTQKRIDAFKTNAPKMFAAMDNIQNEHGEVVDVMVGVDNMSSHNGKNEFSFTTNSKGEVRMQSSLFAGEKPVINTVNIFLSENSIMGKTDTGKVPTTLQVTKHEMGHANYNIKNASSYKTYLNGLKNSAKAKQGHNSGNPSGKRANVWENKKDL